MVAERGWQALWVMLVIANCLEAVRGEGEFVRRGPWLAQAQPDAVAATAKSKYGKEEGALSEREVEERRARNAAIYVEKAARGTARPSNPKAPPLYFHDLFLYLNLFLSFLVAFLCARNLMSPHQSQRSGHVSSMGSGSVVLASGTAFLSLAILFSNRVIDLRMLWISNLFLSLMAWRPYAMNNLPAFGFAWPFLGGGLVAV